MHTSNAATDIMYTLHNLTIEAAPNIDFSATGATKTIDYINPDFSNNTPAFPQEGCISLFTYGHTPFVTTGSIKSNTAIVVDSTMTVIQVINKAPSIGVKPNFSEATNVVVPEGGFVLLACDSSYATSGYKKYIAENFEVGDIVKLKQNGTVISLPTILELTGQNAVEASLVLNYTDMYSTSDSSAIISGSIKSRKAESTYSIHIEHYDENNQLVTTYALSSSNSINTDGSFSISVPLDLGANYFDVTLLENTTPLHKTTTSEIIVRTEHNQKNKPIVLWIDQYSSAKNLNSVDKIKAMVSTAKKAGVTAFAFDVKGCEGYASYKKADLTSVPYMTETKTATKDVSMEIDFLEEMILAAHSEGIKLYASFNFFTEGNITNSDSALDIFHNHRDWAEVLYAPEDNGELKSVLDSSRDSTLVYVNPANDEVVYFQLLRVSEVLKNYDVDGIIMDRTRYDNQYADFSNVTKTKFESYLQSVGKTLTNWPEDIYTFDSTNTIVPGTLYNDWLTFRSNIIKEFVIHLNTLVSQYEIVKGKKIELSAYVGSWYESLYQNGVNWADKDFIYNSRLNLPNASLYTSEYAKTSYTDYIDFIMTGCYYPTGSQIAHYTALGDILTRRRIPVYGSIDVTTLDSAANLTDCFQSAYNTSDGTMIFDLVYIDWYKMQCAIQNKEYENPYTIATYNPDTKEKITITDMNTARTNDTIIIYNDSYGDTTGTNQWGVEIVVDNTGHVIKTSNQAQATLWDWSVCDLNNNKIPDKGFVLSAMDSSGQKTMRQLLANSFNIGDKISVAALTNYTDYKLVQYSSAKQTLSFNVYTFGVEKSCKVLVNNIEVACVDAATSKYELPVQLVNGSNKFKVEVIIDGISVLSKDIILTGFNIPTQS